MGKNIIIIVSVILIVYFIKTSLLSEKEVVISESVSEVKIQLDNKTGTDKKEIDNNINSNKNQFSSKQKDLSHYSFFEVSDLCGFSQELYDKEIEKIDYQLLKEEEIEKVNKAKQNCNKWFTKLKDVPVEKLKQLEFDVNKKRILSSKLNIFKYDKDTLNLARKEIFNNDPNIKFISLSYLLKFDFVFQKQVAQQMNVSQINYLTTDGINLNMLYTCYHGYDCSAQSQIMQETCGRDENSCGMSFPVWLRSGQISLNLYDDMMRAIIAIDKVLDSDWFLEHPLDI